MSLSVGTVLKGSLALWQASVIRRISLPDAEGIALGFLQQDYSQRESLVPRRCQDWHSLDVNTDFRTIIINATDGYIAAFGPGKFTNHHLGGKPCSDQNHAFRTGGIAPDGFDQYARSKPRAREETRPSKRLSMT